MRRILTAMMLLCFILSTAACAGKSVGTASTPPVSASEKAPATETPVAAVSDGEQTTSEAWAGDWYRTGTGLFDTATVSIIGETGTDFNFHLEAYSGANMGMLEGTAELKGTGAVYEDSETGAKLDFTLENGLLTVTANDAANGQAGMGVWFDGTYSKEARPADTLLSQGYVSTQAQDDAFRKMTGKDYELFLYTAHIGYEAEDTDGLDAEVYTWMVRGLGGYNESIVMLLPDGTLCAAVIDPGNNAIKVYTNNTGIQDVPKTIRQWAESFPEFPVEFKGSADS